jgi:hypothetical protein
MSRYAELRSPDHSGCGVQGLGVDTSTGLAYAVFYCPKHDESFKVALPLEPADDGDA